MLYDHLTPGSAFEQNCSLAVHPKDRKEEGGTSPREDSCVIGLSVVVS